MASGVRCPEVDPPATSAGGRTRIALRLRRQCGADGYRLAPPPHDRHGPPLQGSQHQPKLARGHLRQPRQRPRGSRTMSVPAFNHYAVWAIYRSEMSRAWSETTLSSGVVQAGSDARSAAKMQRRAAKRLSVSALAFPSPLWGGDRGGGRGVAHMWCGSSPSARGAAKVRTPETIFRSLRCGR